MKRYYGVELSSLRYYLSLNVIAYA